MITLKILVLLCFKIHLLLQPTPAPIWVWVSLLGHNMFQEVKGCVLHILKEQIMQEQTST